MGMQLLRSYSADKEYRASSTAKKMQVRGFIRVWRKDGLRKVGPPPLNFCWSSQQDNFV